MIFKIIGPGRRFLLQIEVVERINRFIREQVPLWIFSAQAEIKKENLENESINP